MRLRYTDRTDPGDGLRGGRAGRRAGTKRIVIGGVRIALWRDSKGRISLSIGVFCVGEISRGCPKTEAVEAIPTVENLEDAERRVAEEKVSVRCAYQAKQ